MMFVEFSLMSSLSIEYPTLIRYVPTGQSSGFVDLTGHVYPLGHSSHDSAPFSIRVG